MKPLRSYSDDEIARYVLGLDMPDRVADIQSRLAHDDAAAARALKWEAYFLGIVDALPAQPAPDAVLDRIRQSLGMEMEETPVMGETRTAEAAPPRTASENASPRRRARRGPRLRRGRVVLVLGIGVALCLVAVAIWASLRPAPAGTVVRHPVQLGSR
jgi:anti-sigma-K factor RskA